MPDDDRVTLRDHFQAQLEWIDRYFDVRLGASKLAVDKAEQQLNARLETMNEIRSQLKDQNATFVTRTEHEEFGKRLALLERHESSIAGRSAVSGVLWAFGGSIVGAVIVAVLIKVIVK